MAIRLRSLAIKLSSSSAAAVYNFTRSTTIYSCYNNVIKASPKSGINSSFIKNYTKFSPYNHARNYSCYNVIRDSIESGINSLAVTKGEKSTSSNIDEQNLKKVIATYTSDVWISMKNLLTKYNQTQVLLNNNWVDFSFLFDHDNNVGRLAFASGGSMGGSSFPRGGGGGRSSSGSSLTSSSRGGYSSYRPSSCSSYRSSGPNRGGDDDGGAFVLILIALYVVFKVLYWIGILISDYLSIPKNSVIKLQVGLSGTVGSLQKDLNSICKAADTSGERGYRYILQETAAALIRNLDNGIMCRSFVDVNRGIENSEKVYRQLIMNERSKFDELTLVNVDNIKKEKETSGRYNVFDNEYIVITIIVCAAGVHRLPPIKNREDFKKALEILSSIPYQILGVEVLWTPQLKDDVLTREELLKNYPLLQPLDRSLENWVI